MFTASGAFFDELHAFRDYQGEANEIVEVIGKHRRRPVDSLLDVGCGTGRHLAELTNFYRCEGVDLDGRLLKLARAKVPAARFTEADMCKLRLNRRFDSITCLFGTIAHARTFERLVQCFEHFATHLRAGGLVVIQPWYRSAERCPSLQVRHVDRAHVKIARMSHTLIDGAEAIVNINYLVGTPTGIEHVEEIHELGIFSHDEHLEALHEAGFEATMAIDALGPGVDLYIGTQMQAAPDSTE